MIYVPSLITLAGLMVSVGGIAFRLPVLLLLGLAFDVLDGATAREYGVQTAYGAAFDWHTDVAIAAALACMLSPMLLIAWVPWVALASVRGIRVSGRAAFTVAIAIVWGLA